MRVAIIITIDTYTYTKAYYLGNHFPFPWEGLRKLFGIRVLIDNINIKTRINLFEHTGLLDLVTIWTHGILYYKYINLCASLAIWTNGNFFWFGIPPPIFNVRVSVIFLLVSYLIESQLQQNITQHHSVI